MSKHDDGGPVYPFELQECKNSKGNITYVASTGMSLREYFAAHATDADIEAYIRKASYTNANVDDRVRGRYDFADAMIAEMRKREAQNEG